MILPALLIGLGLYALASSDSEEGGAPTDNTTSDKNVFDYAWIGVLSESAKHPSVGQKVGLSVTPMSKIKPIFDKSKALDKDDVDGAAKLLVELQDVIVKGAMCQGTVTGMGHGLKKIAPNAPEDDFAIVRVDSIQNTGAYGTPKIGDLVAAG